MKEFSEVVLGVMHAGEGGVEGNAEKAGNFPEGEPGLGPQGEDGLLVGMQAFDGGLNPVGEVALLGVVAGGRLAGGEGVFEGMGGAGKWLMDGEDGFVFAEGVEDEVVGDAEEPTEEAAAVKPVEVADGFEPGFLDDVFGLIGVSGEAQGKGIEGRASRFDRALEGVKIAISIFEYPSFQLVHAYRDCDVGAEVRRVSRGRSHW